MLSLIAAVSKQKRTEKIENRLREAVLQGKRALLIVPEQASFYNEKRIEEQLGDYAKGAEAVSFSRLANRILQNLGGRERSVATPAAQMFLMSVALDEVSDVLEVYKRHYKSRGFIEQMLGVINECENAGITPEKLSAAAHAMPEGSLNQKTRELAIIYDGFQAIMAQSYMSPSDIITQAAKRLDNSGLLKNTEIFIDDFGGFTSPELDLIESLLNNTQGVAITLCCDNIPTKQPAFALSADTAMRLLKIAENLGCEVEVTRADEDSTGGSLAAMELSQRSENMPDTKSADAAVTAFLCDSPYDELETVAAEISRQIFQKGARYRDFAVIARDMSRYSAALPSVFSRFKLPFFWDMKRDARSSLLTSTVLQAVMAACSMRNSDVLSVARSPLLGLSAELIGELENYCFVWSLKSSDWKQPFINNPDGMTERFSDEARERLASLEAARQEVASVLGRLSSAIKTGVGKNIARGIWDFLQEIKTAENMNLFAQNMAEEQRRLFLDEQSLLWQQMIELLELFASVSDEVLFSSERVCELLEISFGGFEVATVPRTLDEIAVGTADRIRCENVKTVFLLGVAEGEFPLSSMPGGILSEPERRKLCEMGLDLLTEGDRSQATEKMLCYRVVTAPSEQLFVCCPKTDAAGAPLIPSDIFMRANALSKPYEGHRLDRIWSLSCLEKSIAEHCGESSASAATLLTLGAELLSEQRLKSLTEAQNKVPHGLKEPSVAKKLFGDELNISPSRLEQYYKCPFTYFMQKGLKTKKLIKAELSPMQAGTLIHRVLEKVVSAHGGKGLKAVAQDELMAEINDEISAYITECAGEGQNVPARLKSNIERLGIWLFDMIVRLAEELFQSEFEPVAFEMPIKRGGAVKPITLQTLTGEKISVEGTVDRVDIAVIGNQKYVRVIDYKSGTKKFLLEDVYYGLNLQMLIYLFSIAQNGEGLFNGAMPAGALYVPAQGGYISSTRNEDGFKFEKKRQKQYTMNGLLLADDEVLKAMEHELEGVYIPYIEGKKCDALYNLEELGKLWRMVENKVCEMAESLYGGGIAAEPISRDGDTPCSYCDYRSACGFEEGDPVNTMQKLKRDELFGQGGVR